MHSVDPTTEQMIRSVLAYAENRLRLDPVPLDGSRRDPAEFDALLRGLTGDALRAAIAADGDPSSLAAVVATAGTTNAGIIDDLAGAAEVARDHGLWFHVDGAYGGAGLFAPSVRSAYDGIEHADSFVLDPHKWLFAPFDCAALLYRDPALARSVHK